MSQRTDEILMDIDNKLGEISRSLSIIALSKCLEDEHDGATKFIFEGIER